MPVRTSLAGRWSTALAMALLGLAPFVVLSTAAFLQAAAQSDDLHTSRSALQMVNGLANGAYAFGVVAAADLARRVPARRLYLTCTSVLAAAAILSALSPSLGGFAAGRILHGAATGMLLIIALPPLVTRHGPEAVPRSVALLNLGLFGGATLGIPVGGLTAEPEQWRILYALVAVIGLVAFVVGLFGFTRGEAPDPYARFDPSGVPVAAVGTLLPFLGIGLLPAGSPVLAAVLVGVGLAAVVTLVVREYRSSHPLMPAEVLVHTLPVVGVGAAMVTGAVFTALSELAVLLLHQVNGLSPVTTGAVLITEIAGMGLAVWLIMRIVPTRWLPVLVLSGLVLGAAAGVVLALAGTIEPVAACAVAGLLLGVGAGAGVGPGLFLGALSVPAPRLGPAFALVQLLRSEAAFLPGPAVLALATGPTAIAASAGVVAVTAVAGVVLLTGVLLLGGARPHAPDLDRWVAGDGPAYYSPPLLRVLRHRGSRSR
jgi:MFS family permease